MQLIVECTLRARESIDKFCCLFMLMQEQCVRPTISRNTWNSHLSCLKLLATIGFNLLELYQNCVSSSTNIDELILSLLLALQIHIWIYIGVEIFCWLYLLTFSNDPDHNVKFVQYIEFSFDYIHIAYRCHFHITNYISAETIIVCKGSNKLTSF